MSFILTVIVNGYPTKFLIQQDAVDRFIEDVNRASIEKWVAVNSTDGTKGLLALAGSINGIILEDAQ